VAQNRILNAKECLCEPIAYLHDSRYGMLYDIEMINNTSQEILLAVQEKVSEVEKGVCPVSTHQERMAQIEHDVSVYQNNSRISDSFLCLHHGL
jgi:hypothetical protein